MITNNNNQNEYYLTDLIEIITKREGIDVEILKISCDENYKVSGVNTYEQLIHVEKQMIEKINQNTNNIYNNDENFTMY